MTSTLPPSIFFYFAADKRPFFPLAAHGHKDTLGNLAVGVTDYDTAALYQQVATFRVYQYAVHPCFTFSFS